MLNQTSELKVFNLLSKAINEISNEDLSAVVMVGKCPYPSQYLIGVPLGMYHCPICGLMVVAGMHHGPYKWIGKDYESGYADFDIPDEIK